MHPFVERAVQKAIDEEAHPDDRLDELGWDIFRLATVMGAGRATAALQAMDGNLRQRELVFADLQRRFERWARNLWKDFGPSALEAASADEQLAFWRPR